MVGVVLLDEHMAVEAAHFRDGEHADAAEGAGGNRQDLALGHIGPQLAVRGALEAEEGDVAGDDVALQGALGDLLRQVARHDHLILHCAGRQLASCCISTMESHKGILLRIIKFALDIAFVHIIWYGVVDVKKCYCIITDHCADVLT